jgi:putative endonuclease
MTQNRKSLGNQCENIAVNYLISKNYSIIKRNFRLRIGEIDIIACKNDTLVFVEVKGQNAPVFGEPTALVDKRKQNQIIRAAQVYLGNISKEYNEYRFDVITVVLFPTGEPVIEHYPAAFEVEEGYY